MKTKTLVVLAILCAVGCSGSNKKSMTAVTGKVTMGGKPLSGALVQFIPMSKEGEPGSGRTDDSGVYTVTSSRGGDGLRSGKYKVVISRQVGKDGKPLPADVSPYSGGGKESLPVWFSSPEDTRLTADVPETGPAKQDFPLSDR
jgi:hypothetical protein